MIDIAPTYHPAPEAEGPILQQITGELSQALSCSITHAGAIGRGQNLNYVLTTTSTRYPQVLLRILSRKGYPSLETLQTCYAHLHSIGMTDLEILYSTSTSSCVPYGFFIQPWIVGTCAADVHQDPVCDTTWLEAFLAVLHRVHSITLPYFGYLGGGPNYPDVHAYFDHMDTVIDHSFGQVTPADFSIWELDELRITSPSFLAATFDTVKDWAQRIVSPIQSVLVHGDMFPANLLYTDHGTVLIDWDETRANWWVYELARTLFYFKNRHLFEHAVATYADRSAGLTEIETGIHLEHTRQYLRQICMATFGAPNMDDAKRKVRQLEAQITGILHHYCGR